MAGGAALLQDEAAQPRPIVVKQRGGAHRAGDKNCALRKFFGEKREALPGKLMQEPVGDVGKVVQPVPQIGVGLALKPGARVVLNTLDRGLRGQPRTHGLSQPTEPSAVMRDHPEGFEHVTMLAALAVVVPVDQFVHRSAHGADRRLKPLQLRLDVVSDDLDTVTRG